MLRPVRASVHVLTALALLTAPMLAPEHVHEADAHHHDTVVHRHLEAHAHDAASVGDDDGPVVWLVSVGVVAHALQVDGVALTPGRYELAPSFDRIDARSQVTLDIAHGPPRSTLASRAPPPSI
jgi:hypothetical protein